MTYFQPYPSITSPPHKDTARSQSIIPIAQGNGNITTTTSNSNSSSQANFTQLRQVVFPWDKAVKWSTLVRKDTFQQQVFPEGVSPVMEVTHTNGVPHTAPRHPQRVRERRNGANAHRDFGVTLPRGIFHTRVSFPKTPALKGTCLNPPPPTTEAATLGTSCHLTLPSTGAEEPPGPFRGWSTGVTALGGSSAKPQPPKAPPPHR